MEKQIEWITSRQANEYINEQLEKLLLCEDFKKNLQESSLLRLKEHHIQMVCREIRSEEIKIKLVISPVWIYCDNYHHIKNMRLKWSNKSNLISNIYTDIAYKQKISQKMFYKNEELLNVCDTVILPQIQEEIIGLYAKIDFNTYALLCENKSEQDWKVDHEDAVCQNLILGYNYFWKKQYERGKIYLKNAILNKEKVSAGYGEKKEYAQDIENAKVILEVYDKREADWEKVIFNKLTIMEDTTMQRYLYNSQ